MKAIINIEYIIYCHPKEKKMYKEKKNKCTRILHDGKNRVKKFVYIPNQSYITIYNVNCK